MNSRSVVLFVLLLVMVLPLFSADLSAPTSLLFSNNVTSAYDEGSFFLNWTAPAGSVSEYYIYTYADDVLFSRSSNDSTTGLVFTNATEANYTFVVSGINATDSVEGANSTNVSMYIDSSGPTITFSGYTNGTAKMNSTTLTLNISILDSGSGLTESLCKFDINGINQTIVPSSGWCNTTNGNLTGLTDGNSTIKIYVNNTVGIFGLNNSFVVQSDTTSPTGTFSCSPSSAGVGDTVTCTCSPTDSTSGINSTRTSYVASPSTSLSGTFTKTCSFYDLAGNSGSASATYSVNYLGGSSSGSSSSTQTYTLSENQFEQGYIKDLGENDKIIIPFGGEFHHVSVLSIDSSSALVEIASNPVQVSLNVGEDAKIDLDGDGFYDLYVILNSLSSSKANLTVEKIHEAVPEGSTGLSTTGQEVNQSGDFVPEEDNTSGIGWTIAIIVIVLILIGFGAKNILENKFMQLVLLF